MSNATNSERPPVGAMVIVGPPYRSDLNGPGADAWTGIQMRVLAWSGDDALLGQPDETSADEWSVAIHADRLTAVWYDSLPQTERDALFAWMRQTDERARGYERERLSLEAPAGSIAAGPAAFDSWVRGAVFQRYLQALRQGQDPAAALQDTLSYARTCVAKHNAKRPRDVCWQRWEGTADGHIHALHGSLTAALGRAKGSEGVSG